MPTLRENLNPRKSELLGQTSLIPSFGIPKQPASPKQTNACYAYYGGGCHYLYLFVITAVVGLMTSLNSTGTELQPTLS